MAEEVEKKTLPKYSLKEVAKHKTADSLWLVVHGKVYDITKFMEEVS
jgi:cytochrome b involved in lipid metabolism